MEIGIGGFDVQLAYKLGHEKKGHIVTAFYHDLGDHATLAWAVFGPFICPVDGMAVVAKERYERARNPRFPV